MTTIRTNLFTRPDTLFGVCEGLSEETGVPPMLFRIAFALPLIFAPFAVMTVYLALGVTLVAMRWRVPATAPTLPATVQPTSPQAENDDSALARAA